jgi:hypothetical protein
MADDDNNDDERLQPGTFFWETVWYKVAEKVVAKAIEVYKLDAGQAEALRSVYLRPNLYQVKPC